MSNTKLTPPRKDAENKLARALLDTLTNAQLDDLGMQFGMSNMGLPSNSRPQDLAETEEDYDYLMEEINHWRQLLRNPKENWGCFYPHDLIELVQTARKRNPYSHDQLCKLLGLVLETPKEMVQDMAQEKGLIGEVVIKQY